MKFTEEEREEVAEILEIVARDRLKGPKDLDVALDAIEASIGSRVPTWVWLTSGYISGVLMFVLTLFL